jgi:hypothetical protein
MKMRTCRLSAPDLPYHWLWHHRTVQSISSVMLGLSPHTGHVGCLPLIYLIIGSGTTELFIVY